MPPEHPPQRPPDPYEIIAFSAELNTDTPEVDLHGMRVDEALDVLERAIDQAMYRNEEAVRVIHGRGTGKLQNAIRDYLKTHTEHVGYFRDSNAPGQQGGVTIVVLRV